MDTIGKTIKEIRENNNLSQTEFANVLNVSRSYIAKMEAGKAMPTFDFLLSVYNDYKVNLLNVFINNQNDLINVYNKEHLNVYEKVQSMYNNEEINQSEKAKEKISQLNKILSDLQIINKDSNFILDAFIDGNGRFFVAKLIGLDEAVKCLHLFSQINDYKPITDYYDTACTMSDFEEKRKLFESTPIEKLPSKFLKNFEDTLVDVNNAINQDLVNMLKFHLREKGAWKDGYKE